MTRILGHELARELTEAELDLVSGGREKGGGGGGNTATNSSSGGRGDDCDNDTIDDYLCC